MTGIFYDKISEDWEIRIDRPDGELCEGWAPTAQEATRRLEEIIARWQRHDIEHARAVAFAEQQRREAQEREAEKQRPQKQRCPWHRSIRRFFAIAKERDLDVSQQNEEAIRVALSAFFGKEIESRSTLTATDWFEAGTAVKKKKLVW
jgi:alkylated DNA nucleotide flippase Atl1